MYILFLLCVACECVCVGARARACGGVMCEISAAQAGAHACSRESPKCPGVRTLASGYGALCFMMIIIFTVLKLSTL